jgi:hypothetical protein
MRNLCLSFLSVLMINMVAGFTPTQASPLNLDVNIQHTKIPEIPGFRYWYGDITTWKKLIFIGTEDLAGFETELQLTFRNKKIVNAVFILGPAGMDDENCIKSYKKVIKLLNKKYGHFRNQIIEKDPLIDELIAVSVCHPIQAGLYTPTTIWVNKGNRITATLLGEENQFFIEIEYQFGPKLIEESVLLKAL